MPPPALPLQLTTFVGRDRELATLHDLLDQSRLLTLTGTGGIGKSRLALRFAEDLHTAFPDGIWLAELAALAEPSLVPHAVAAAAGVRERSDVPMLDAVADEIRDQHALLVLDNCEHLLSGCAEVVDRLLRRCPRLHVLATSRQSLGVAGEITWRVPPLALPDPDNTAGTDELAGYEAISLFVERARLVAPGLHLGDGNATSITHICCRLDGIPLAIELAAARVKSLGLDQIAARLDDRFQLLTSGPRGALERHQTLRGTVEWSYDLLSQPERTLFRRLGVFAGAFALEAAEYVCQLPVIDLLGQLVDKSLVLLERYDGYARYRLLETLRQFALEHAQHAGELHEVRHRHLEWFSDLANRAGGALNGPEQAIGLRTLDDEHDNIRAALGWALEASYIEAGLRLAVGCAYYWEIRGHSYRGEARRWFDQLLERHAYSDDSLTAEALEWAATFAAQLFDFRRAADLYTACLAICERLPDARQLGEALLRSGAMYRLLGRYEEAENVLQRSLVIARERNDALAQAHALRQLGVLSRDAGQPDEADARNVQSLNLFESLGELHQAGHLLDQVGEAARERRQYARAAEAHERSLDLLRAAGCQEGEKSSLSHMAQLEYCRGRLLEAHELCIESLRREIAIGMRRDVPTCLELLATLCVADDAGRAARLLAAADGLRESMGTVRPRADDALVEQTRLRAQKKIGAEEWPALSSAGRALGLSRAIEYAVETPPPGQGAGPLTRREREVAALVGQGLSNRQIAEMLVLSVRTTEAHVAHVLSKLELRSRAQLVRWVAEHGA